MSEIATQNSMLLHAFVNPISYFPFICCNPYANKKRGPEGSRVIFAALVSLSVFDSEAENSFRPPSFVHHLS